MSNAQAPGWVSNRYPRVTAWVRLGDIAEINPQSLGEATPPNFEFEYIDLGSVDEGRIALPLQRTRFECAPSRARRLVRRGDVLIATVRPLLGGHARLQSVGASPTVASTGFAAIRAKNDEGAGLVWHCLRTNLVRRQFHAKVTGSSYPAVNEADIGELWLPKPSTAALRKVLAAADALDLAIEKTDALIAAKREQKRGLMQQLLTGKVRFPGFTEPWKTVRLGDVADVHFSNVDKHTIPGERQVRLCNYTDVFRNRFLHPDMDFMSASATAREIEKFGLQVGDVAITKDSETPDEIGVPALIDRTAPDLVLGYHLALLRADRARLDPGFLLILMESDLVRAHFQRRAKGLTRFALSIGAVADTPISLPKLGEQTKIAKIYRDITMEESLLKAQRASFVTQRHGLMERLLSGDILIPSSNTSAA